MTSPPQDLERRYQAVMAENLQAKRNDRRGVRFPFDRNELFNQCLKYEVSLGISCATVLFELCQNLYITRQGIEFRFLDERKNTKRVRIDPKTLKCVLEEKGIPYQEEAVTEFLRYLQGQFRRFLDQRFQQDLIVFHSSPQISVRNVKQTVCDVTQLRNACDYYDGHLAQCYGDLPASGATIIAARIQQNTGLPPSQCKKLLGIINDYKSADSGFLPTPLTEQYEQLEREHPAILFTCAGGTYHLRYDMREASFQAVPFSNPPRHSLKVLKDLDVPDFEERDFLRVMREITGGDTELMDQFARLFAQIADTGRKQSRLTVIYTYHNAFTIEHLLKRVFPELLVDTDDGLGNLSVNINRILTVNGKNELLNAQIAGKGLILMDEKLPTPPHFADFIAMSNGQCIRVQSQSATAQSFHNHLHLVCVTGLARVKDTLKTQFGADVIDLTAKEQKSPWAQDQRNGWEYAIALPEEINWLRTAFLAHGCRLLAEKKTPRKKRVSASHEELLEFIKTCCICSPKQVCEREELYQAYCRFYRARHGCETKESSVTFGKLIRALELKDVEYKVKRYGSDQKTHLCYIGLGLREQTSATQTVSNDGFQAYLSQIHEQAQGIFPPAIRVSVKRG